MWLNSCRLKQMHNLPANKSPQERLDKWLNSRSESIYDGLRTPENGIQHGKIEHEICKQRC
jgi:hypothetical protein